MNNCLTCDKEIPRGSKCGSCFSNERRFAIKIAALEAKGGKCIRCGYCECSQALTFHHLDPKLKAFAISGAHCRSEKIIEDELRKCVVLCQNCHHGLHAGFYFIEEHLHKNVDLPFNYTKLKEPKPKLYRNTNQVAGLFRRQFEITKEELEKLIYEFPLEVIGIKLGVSGSAIKKRAKKLGITNFPGRGYWTKKK